MVAFLLAVVSSLVDPRVDSLAHGARATAPSYLTADTARDHAFAALVAAKTYDVDPSLVLSISWHESRYIADTVTAERGGKWSCGPMTPEPLAQAGGACLLARRSLLAGYLAGARHLRVWLDVCHGSERCGLVGYGGGFALLRLCATDDVRGCHLPEVFRARADAIRRAGAA